MTQIDDKKARLQALMAKSKNEGNNSRTTTSSGDNASFQFWDMKSGEQTVIRLLPDGDPDSPRFWVYRETITLEFDGIVGGQYPTNKKVTITVPCMKMYGPKEVCPITEAIRPWWTDRKQDALKYYRKRTLVAQGFVVSTSLNEKDPPENPIRRFVFGPQLAKIIEADVDDIDYSHLPVDYVHGRDFKIIVTKNGEHNNYTSSKFSPKERTLSEEELAAIDTYGLFDLAQVALPKKPSEADLEVIMQLFHDSVAGLPFDADKYANSPYKPYVRRDGQAPASAPAAAPVARTSIPATKAVAATTPDAEADEVVVDVAPAAEAPKQTAAPSGDAQAILARIRNKTAAAGN